MTLNQTTLKIQLLVSRPKEMGLEDIRKKGERNIGNIQVEEVKER